MVSIRGIFPSRRRNAGEWVTEMIIRALVIIIFMAYLVPLELVPRPEWLPVELYGVFWGIISVAIAILIAYPVTRAISWSIRRSARIESN